MRRIPHLLAWLVLAVLVVPATAQIGWVVIDGVLQYGGRVSILQSGQATTSTDGLTVSNTTPATAGATVQLSPRIRQSGTGWDSDDSVSRTVSFFTEALPATGATVTGTWKLGYIAADGTTTTYPMTVTSGGAVTSLGHVVAGDRLIANGGIIRFPSSSQWISVADGKSNFTMDASTTGVGIDVTADATLKVRTRAQTGYAAVEASDVAAVGANGQSLAIKQLSELTTIAAAATTDTTIQMPANAIVLAVNVRVTTVIPTAATFTVGDSGSAARFSTAAVSSAATSTDAGTKAGAYYNASALAIRITPNATPADNTGRVRVTIYYLLSTPPTS